MNNTEEILNPKDFVERISERAGGYFADLDRERALVSFLGSSSTRNSRLLEFHVTDGHVSHNVIAKVPFSARRLRPEGHAKKRADRPRLFPLADTRVKGLHEFEALSKIYEHFGSISDPRFEAVRPLDFFGDPCCLMMEKATGSSLKLAWRRVNRLQHDLVRTELHFGINNAGSWLRRFHAMPFLPHTREWRTSRSDIIAAINMFCDYLKSSSGDAFFSGLGAKLTTSASEILPHSLPLGLTHRDFAPRNVLLNAEGQITVLDTQASWHAPIYADLAYFLIALKVSSLQVCSAGAYCDSGTLAAFERTFLRGYFQEAPVPTSTIRVFECLLLLEWWVQLVHYFSGTSGLLRAARWGQLVACSRYLRRYLSRLMDQMDEYITSASVKSDDLSERLLAEAG